jgi:hypothetical protein
VTLLESLGLPKDIAQASVDHDHPRPAPEVPKTLEDVVYLGNLLAGGYYSWLQLDTDTLEEEIKSIREKYAHLLPQIEAEASEMQGALG